MRKTIIASNGYALAAEQTHSEQTWLDLVSIARVELSSEDAEHPVEKAFSMRMPATGPGWRAAELGPQTLRLFFDVPQTITRVVVQFHEGTTERMQEFSLDVTLSDGRTQHIVRQQWNFSPDGSTDERETYDVELAGVVGLTLWIDPDRGMDRYPATLQLFRVEG